MFGFALLKIFGCKCSTVVDLSEFLERRKRMVQLGDKVRDVITGYTGIAVAKTEWLNKCVRIGVQSQEVKDGKPVEAQWFDQEQIEVIETAAVVITKRPTGGPRGVETVQRCDPSR